MDFVSKNKSLFIYLFIAFIFLCLGVYSYYTYLKPKVYPTYVENKEYLRKKESEQTEKDVDIILFYTNWCPHSRNAMTQWNKVKTVYDNKKKGNYIVHFKEVDCDEEEDIADKFNIKGYPTIKLEKSKSEIIEFDAKPTDKTLIAFLDTVLGK